MRTFSVQREVVKEVVVEKKVLEKMDVGIFDIHPREIKRMPLQQVQKYAAVMLKECHSLQKELIELKSASRPQETGTEPSPASTSPSTEEKDKINALLKENAEIRQAMRDLDEHVAFKEAYFKHLNRIVEESNFITPSDEAKALAAAAEETDRVIDVEATEPILTVPLHSKSKGKTKAGSGGGSTIGKKIGKTSKYRYVNVQKRNGKFQNFKANTTINGESVAMGSSKDEIECALIVDAYLDKIGDTERKRNRDDFPEVMEAYMKKVGEHAEQYGEYQGQTGLDER
jgi:hypothetical protein